MRMAHTQAASEHSRNMKDGFLGKASLLGSIRDGMIRNDDCAYFRDDDDGGKRHCCIGCADECLLVDAETRRDSVVSWDTMRLCCQPLCDVLF